MVIDLQKGILARSVPAMAEVVERSARLAAAFRRRGLPVVLVNVSGRAPGRTEAGRRQNAAAPAPDWLEIVDELDPQSSDLRVTKQRWGAFHGTSLHEQLQGLGVTQLLFVGVSTSAGVESSARAAHELGYHVVLAIDAMTDFDPDVHINSTQRIFPKLGETATTDEILRELDRAA